MAVRKDKVVVSKPGSEKIRPPYPVKKFDPEAIGMKAFTSSNEIQRFLDNP